MATYEYEQDEPVKENSEAKQNTPDEFFQEGFLVGLIAEEDSCVGFLLAGIGQCNEFGDENFLAVTEKTSDRKIEDFFHELYNRKDIAIILIEKDISKRVLHASKYIKNLFPIVLEIPSKKSPFDVDDDRFIAHATAIAGEE